MKSFVRAGGLALLLWWAAAGCARFEPHEISASRSATLRESLSLTNAQLQAFLEKNLQRDWTRWPALPWDLDMLTLAAFYYHPDLEVARAQWRVAEAGIKTAGGRPNPTVSVVPEYDFTPASGVSPWLPSILFDLPLETAGKRDYRQARARHLSEAARLNVATAAWQVRGNLRNSLIDLAAAEKRREVLQRQLSLQEEIITMLEQRRQAGAISSVETTAARVALAKTGVDLAEAERLRAESRARLSGAVGVPIRALDEIALAPASAAGAEAGELAGSEARRRALESRFDILGALAEYAASQSALQLEIAKQYPDVHLGTGYQWDQGDNKWQLGLTAEIPVLNRNQGPIAEAEARRSEAAARFEAIQAKVLAEVDRAVETFRASEKNLTNLEALAAALRTQRQTIEAEVTAGAADRLDLLNSQIELSTTELIRLDGQLKREQALAALEDVTQRPLDFYPAAFRSARAHAD